jgi:molybdopterin-biosynthesis enzyme MoeA-like protein
VTHTTYVIELGGRLPAALASELATFDQQADDVTTVLTGQIVDTAALYGLLARLESFGVALISIRPVPDTLEVH